MGSRDRPSKEAKKKPKAKNDGVQKLSSLADPPQNVELIRKPRKERRVVETDDTDEA